MYFKKMNKTQFSCLMFAIAIAVAAITLYLTCLFKLAITSPFDVCYSPFKLAAYVKENGFPLTVYCVFTVLAEIPFFAYLPRMAKRAGEKDVLGRDFYTADDNQVYGDSHFEKPEEYADAALVQNVDDAYGTIFGQLSNDGSRLINFRPDSENRLNSHIVVVGASGSGKTYTFTKPFAYQAIKRRESVIFTDPDGGLTRDLSNLFRENGYVVRVFDLKNPKKSDGWNCMGSIVNSDNMELSAHLFADAIISNIPGSTNTQPIFHDGPLALLKALLLRVAADNQDTFDEKTIRSVYGILQNGGGEGYLNNVIFNEDMLRNNEAKVSLGSYNSFKLASDNLRGNIITSLATSLNLLQAGPIADVLSTDGIDLTLPGRQPCAYFCKFPDSHDTYRFIVSLFFSMLFMELVDYADNVCGEKLPVPVNFMLDEFPSIGKLPDFQRKMATIRKRNMNVAMIVQDITQLQDLYEKSWVTLISNCSTLFSLGINDEFTADMVTKRIGETTVEIETKQHQAVESIFTVFNKHSTGKGKRAILSYDELFKLDKDDCVILFQGHNPIHAHKYPHTLHPFSKNILRYDSKERSNITDRIARTAEYDEENRRVNAYLAAHPLDEVDRSFKFVLEPKEEPTAFDKMRSKIQKKKSAAAKKKQENQPQKQNEAFGFDEKIHSVQKYPMKTEPIFDTAEEDDYEEEPTDKSTFFTSEDDFMKYEEEEKLSDKAPKGSTAPYTSPPSSSFKPSDKAPPQPSHKTQHKKVTNNAGFGSAPKVIGQETNVTIRENKAKNSQANHSANRNASAFSNGTASASSALPRSKVEKMAQQESKNSDK